MFFSVGRYLVTHLMGADLNNIVKTQKLSDDHIQFLVYQILRGLKVSVIYLTFVLLGPCIIYDFKEVSNNFEWVKI